MHWCGALAIAIGVAVVHFAACAPSREDEAASSASIGPEGGRLEAGEVSLEIPAGALTSRQVLNVSKTTDGAPAGYRALSAVYRFEPDGLTFAKPVIVTFAVASASADATVFWSRSNQSYDPLATVFDGRVARATIIHFSTGFVGLSDASMSPDGGIPSDAAGGDVSVDGGDPHGSDAGSCIRPPMQQTVATRCSGWAELANACSANTAAGVLPFTVSSPSQATLLHGHNLNFGTWDRLRVVKGCNPPFDLTAALANADGMCATATVAIPPGTYSFYNCFGQYESWARVEAIPPPATNTGCAAAVDLPYTEGRVVDGQPRYFKFTVTSTKDVTISASPEAGVAVGAFTLTVTSGCGGAIVGQTNLDMCTNILPRTYTLSSLTPGTYAVAATNISPGIRFTLAIQ